MTNTDTEVRVSRMPHCDVCKGVGNGNRTAKYDASVEYGGRRTWAFVCQYHFDVGGGRLGLGMGQKLVLDNSPD